MLDDANLKCKLGGFGISVFLRSLMGTLDYRITHYDITTDPARPEFEGRYIYLFWHEYITFPVTIWGGYDVTALVSIHRDGDWITRAANHLGFEIVRGSSSHRGSRALRELKQHSKRANLTIMPDGPLGPRRKTAMGPVYLSSRLGLPIIPVGFGYDRPWRMPTWDKFALPKPYSRARAIFGPPMQIPRKASREQLQGYQDQVDRILNRLTTDAENWAESGKRMKNEYPILRLRKIKKQNLPSAGTDASPSLRVRRAA